MRDTTADIRELGGPKRIVLPDFLSYRNLNDDRYRRLTFDINYFEAPSDTARLAQETVMELLEAANIKAYLEAKLRGEILVDCGGGSEEFMKSIAVQLNAGVYMNIDGKLTEYNQRVNYTEYSEPGPLGTGKIFSIKLREPKEEMATQIHGIEGEILRVIARFPSDSANFIISGIDYDSATEDRDYWRALAEEITRTTKKGGVVLGFGTPIFEYLDRKRFKDIDANLSGGAPHMQGIFEKI